MPEELVKTKEEQESFDAARAAWERRNRIEVEAMFAAEDDKRRQQAEEQAKRDAADRDLRRTQIGKLIERWSGDESAPPPATGPVVELLDQWRLAHEAEQRAIIQLNIAAGSLDVDKARDAASQLMVAREKISHLKDNVRAVLEGLK